MRRSVEVLHFLVETVSPSSMAQLHRMVSHQPFSALTHAPSPKVHKYPSSATFQASAAFLSALRADEALQGGPGCSRIGGWSITITTANAGRWVQRRATWGTIGEPWGTWILEMSSEAEIHAFQQAALPGMRCFHQSVLVEVGLAPSSHSPTFRNPADFVDHPK